MVEAIVLGALAALSQLRRSARNALPCTAIRGVVLVPNNPEPKHGGRHTIARLSPICNNSDTLRACAAGCRFRSVRPASSESAMNKRGWVEFSFPIVIFTIAIHAVAGCSGSNGNATSSTSTGGNTGTGGASGSSTGGSNTGGSSSVKNTEVGRFTVALNPAVDTASPYTSVSGTVRDGVSPTDVIETLKVGNASCAVYALALQSCSPVCSTTQVCVATNVCQDVPARVSVGDVTVTGVGPTSIALSQVSNQYQYAGDITYPGFNPGDSITLSATGGTYGAFNISATGVAPLVLGSDTYNLTLNTPITITWTPEAGSNTRIALMMNLSHHTGTTGYLKCDVPDTGSLTIPADQVTQLINLGVAGYPTFTVTRTSVGEAKVSTGSVLLMVTGNARPALTVTGYDSCVEDLDCPAAKPHCDTGTKLCQP